MESITGGLRSAKRSQKRDYLKSEGLKLDTQELEYHAEHRHQAYCDARKRRKTSKDSSTRSVSKEQSMG